MNTPHYLRVARALALVGSIGGCGTATTADVDTGPLGVDATATSDAGAPDAYFDCSACSCGLTATDAGLPECDAAHIACCAAVGPLPPPDLAA